MAEMLEGCWGHVRFGSTTKVLPAIVQVCTKPDGAWAGEDCSVASTDQPDNGTEYPVHRQGSPESLKCEGCWGPGEDCGAASTGQPEDGREHIVHRQGGPGAAGIQGTPAG